MGERADKNQGDPALRPSFDKPVFNELSAYIAKLSHIKKSQQALNYGDFTSVVLTNRQCIFKRSCNGENIYVAINADENSFSCSFNSEKDTFTDLISGNNIAVKPDFEMKGYTAYILK